jgi:ferredoxin-NADP reductase
MAREKMTGMENTLRELKVIGTRDETPDTRSFILSPVDGQTIRYRPGQFLTLVFPGEVTGKRRSYSMSSTPYLHEPLTITVKRIDNGEFSRYLFDYCGEGASLFTTGVSGFFVLPDDPAAYTDYFFYAAGSGITPILPIIKTLLGNFPRIKVWLSYSNHSVQRTIFYGDLKKLERDHPDALHIEWLFSNAQNLLQARLSKTRVTEHASRFKEKSRTLFYLCGPHEYMQMISITLLREGAPSGNIRKEIFNTIKPRVRELPPDTDAHQVKVRYQRETFLLNVKHPETILSTAKNEGILLPYSCEAGKCGTCAATCVKGAVWMSYNEVLLDKELKEGRILTCTGHPIGGDVELFYPDVSSSTSA